MALLRRPCPGVWANAQNCGKKTEPLTSEDAVRVVVTNLFFGDDRERRIDKFWFLLAALVQDTAQDLVITRYSTHATHLAGVR